MKLGVFTVSMPEYNLQESVDLLKELGYDGVEWRVTDIPKTIPENVPFEGRYWVDNKSTVDIQRIEELAPELKRMCDEKGIEIFGLTTYLRPDTPEKAIPVLRAARAIGVPRVRLFTANYMDTDDQVPFPQLFAQSKEQIKVLEGLAREYGVKIVFEIHHDNILSSASSAIRILEGLDPSCIGLIVDPGNMVYEGYENYQKCFEMLGDYVAHVHVKNSMMVETGRDELGAKVWARKWAPLKEGMADLSKFFHVMKKASYDGTISVEDFSNEMTTREKLKYNHDYIHQLWERA